MRRHTFLNFFNVTAVTLLNRRDKALFLLPSVLDSKTFTKLANTQGEKLELELYEEIKQGSPHLRSRAFLDQAKEKARELCLPLITLKREDVEATIAHKYNLTDERLVTCLVPYQLAANILLSCLPPKVKEEAIRELKVEEAARQRGSLPTSNKWIQWYEADVYASHGWRYLERVSTRRQRRIPVFAAMGHVNHGKTALLDAMLGSRIGAEEPHYITQSVRAFTMTRPGTDNDFFTFIDTPGHRIFVETRFHVQLIADFIMLVISVVEGVESQTHETIKVALNVDRPLIVVLNKLDLLSDAFAAEKAVRRTLAELHTAGLDVELLQKEKDIEALATEASTASRNRDDGMIESISPQAEYFAPMRAIDPTYRGSKRHPQVQLLRKCYGVCVSAATGARLPLLWRLLEVCRDCAPPMCRSNSIGHKEHNAAVQAVVLESSKHLFDEEGFRLNRGRQKIQRSMDLKQQRRTNRFEARSPRSRLNSTFNSVKTQSTRHNRTSTSSLVITAIVKEGVLSEGMHFIADQAEGQVHALIDYWGNRVGKAYPGMAVTLVDKRSMSGCPGAGIHVLSMTDLASRLHVQAYRQRLQWYVEVFTAKLHYLRPRGMDVSFAHLGDYGQLGITDSLECQLLYGPPRKAPGEQRVPEALPPGTSASDESIGAYLAERNRESESNALQVSLVGSVALPDGVTKRLAQAIMRKEDEEVLKASWQSLQLRRQLTSQKEYEDHVAQCVQVGVFIKVDSWHTARMLHREISRLGTRKVYFQVVGARFGPLQVDDLLYFMQAAKVIVCFRTPLAASSDLDSYIENANLWVLQTDHFSDVVLFMKWCALATHKEKVLDEGDDDVDHNDDSDYRLQISVKSKESVAGSGAQRASGSKSARLLVYNADNHDDSDTLGAGLSLHAMSAEQDHPREGPAALDADDIPSSLSRARRLAMTREEPMLALKAYSTWMREESVSESARAVALLDLTLYCNIFALQRLGGGNARDPAQLALARDYFQLVLDEFSALYNVVLPELGRTDGDTESETDTVLSSTTLSDEGTDSIPDGLRVALLITVGNLACVELHVGGEGLAKAAQLLLFSKNMEERMGGVPTLEWPWRIVRELNEAVAAVMHCNFIEGEEAARNAIDFLHLNMEDEASDEVSSVSAVGVPHDEQTSLLLAVGYYTLGVTTESMSCESSLLDYDQAIALVTRDKTGSYLATLMGQTRERLALYVEEEQAKARTAAEEAARTANVERKGRKGLQSKPAKGPSSRRALQKGGSSGLSQSESGLSSIVGPPIPDALCQFLGREGLKTVLVRLGPVGSLYEVLSRSLPGYDEGKDIPQSLFEGTPLKAGAHELLFVVLVCTETPVGWTLRLLKAAENPDALPHSVWNPRPMLASLLTEMAAERPPAPRSVAALRTRKEIVDGSGKLRQQVIQLFSTPENAPALKQKAQESVGAVVGLLGQRLSFLLKTERAFEDHWAATECIKSALSAYAVPQDILRLKTTLLAQKRIGEQRLDRSARIIVHFFRHTVKEKLLLEERRLENQRRVQQREWAAVTLQKYIRRWCAYKEAWRRHAARREYVGKVVVVQSLARQRAAARVFAEVRRLRSKEEFMQAHFVLFSWAALEIQRMYRGHCARLRCYHLRGQVHLATLLHMRDSRNYYATVIQKHVRGLLVRLRYGRAVYAKRCFGRNVYITRLWEHSCLVIQRAYRAYLWRCRAIDYRRPLQVSNYQSSCRHGAGPSRFVLSLINFGGRRPDERRAAAARSIQQMYRSCVARRRLEALKYARMKEAESKNVRLQWGAKSAFSLKDCVF